MLKHMAMNVLMMTSMMTTTSMMMTAMMKGIDTPDTVTCSNFVELDELDDNLSTCFFKSFTTSCSEGISTVNIIK